MALAGLDTQKPVNALEGKVDIDSGPRKWMRP
jgi:hypothetical protein